jgi:ubiquinone/menaquinone biosynthesis C-methylase UbiE
MLDYAKSKSPSNYGFQFCRSLSLPVPDRFADFVTAFGVFTQLSPSEMYLYLEEIKRALKPRGTLIFSFLEFGDPEHRSAFLAEVNNRRAGGMGTDLNTLIERSVIEKWCSEIGYRIALFVDGRSAPWDGHPLCQAIACPQTLRLMMMSCARRSQLSDRGRSIPVPFPAGAFVSPA